MSLFSWLLTMVITLWCDKCDKSLHQYRLYTGQSVCWPVSGMRSQFCSVFVICQKNLNGVDCRCSKKRSKRRKRLNRTLFNQTKQDNANFPWILFFKTTNNTNTNESLSCYHLGAYRRMCAKLEYQKRRGLIFNKEDSLANLKKKIPSKICILSCFVWLKNVLFNFFCVSDLAICQFYFWSNALNWNAQHSQIATMMSSLTLLFIATMFSVTVL